jgi:hypothetical protein
MTERTRSSSLGRGMVVLAIVILGAAAVTPAFSAFRATKGKVRKLAKKESIKQINAVGPGLFIQEGELIRWGPLNMNMDSTQPIGTFGPFSLKAACTDDDLGAGTAIAGEVLIDTSEPNSIVYTESDFEEDWDPGETRGWGGTFNTGQSAGDPPNSFSFRPESGIASTPSGAGITGGTFFHTNFNGFHCVLTGYVIQLSPR